MQKNKFYRNSKYFSITVYAVIGFLICALIVKVVFNFSQVWGAVKVLLGVLSPFVYGTLIAYLINPLFKFLDYTFFGKWLRMTKRKKLRKTLSLLIAYIIVIGILVALFYVVIPQFILSIRSLVSMIGTFSVTLENWITSLEEHFKHLNLEFLTTSIHNLVPTLTEKLKDWAEGVLPTILSTGAGVVTGVVKALLSIFVSVYILADKINLENSIRKIYYALFKPETAARVSKTTRECSNIFSNFFTGKIFDSLIIGIICGVGMLILKLPYPLLVSVIVGFTNIIPSFGPFIGAIPSILIMLMTGWREALVFTIFIIVLQQLDGNVIGPKILGNSTGLSPIWILFAITIGAWVYGVGGMIFGVPIMAVIVHIVEGHVNERLKRRGLDSMVEQEASPKTMHYSELIRNIFKKKEKEIEKEAKEAEAEVIKIEVEMMEEIAAGEKAVEIEETAGENVAEANAVTEEAAGEGAAETDTVDEDL